MLKSTETKLMPLSRRMWEISRDRSLCRTSALNPSDITQTDHHAHNTHSSFLTFTPTSIMDHFLNSAGKKLFERHLQQYAPTDPMYESYVDAKGKERRRRVSISPILTPSRLSLLVFSVQFHLAYLLGTQKSLNLSNVVHTTSTKDSLYVACVSDGHLSLVSSRALVM